LPVPTIRIRRTGRRWAILRKLHVLVDGVRRASVRQGRSVDIEVSPGQHEVAVQMDWAKTPPLTIECSEGSVTTMDAGVAHRRDRRIIRAPSQVFDLTLADTADEAP
jgi:hypothetical protein